ncbi:hypothetical protein ACVWXN_005979 [Bradyrhizobium sp. i1.4.4]
MVFFLAVITAIIFFSDRYASSRIYRWEERTPMAQSFWESRARARAETCSSEPCFSMGKRFDDSGKELEYVDQYLPYLTDGLLAAMFLLFVGGMAYLLFALLAPSRTALSSDPY